MTVNHSARWLLSTSLSLLLVYMTTVPVLAQSIGTVDTEPPVIELEVATEGTAGESQVFTALVVDNRQLRDVTLYYRFVGQQGYVNQLMRPLADTGFYTTIVPTSVNETRSIEYYLQALDQRGNRAVQGYAFDPLTRRLVPASTPLTRATEEPPVPGITPTPADNQRRSSWWYVAAGVLAVGVLAGLSGGGGNGSSPGTADRVNLSIRLQTP